MDVPGPPTYQPVISNPREFDPAFKPFAVGAKRFRAPNKVFVASHGKTYTNGLLKR